jgi:uncharacterized membrane protein (UPF0136 family)
MVMTLRRSNTKKLAMEHELCWKISVSLATALESMLVFFCSREIFSREPNPVKLGTLLAYLSLICFLSTESDQCEGFSVHLFPIMVNEK